MVGPIGNIVPILLTGATGAGATDIAQKVVDALPGIEQGSHKLDPAKVREFINIELNSDQVNILNSLIDGYSAASKKLGFAEGCVMCQGKNLDNLVSMAKRLSAADAKNPALMEAYIHFLIMERKFVSETNQNEAYRSLPYAKKVLGRIKLLKAMKNNPDKFMGMLKTEEGRKELYAKMFGIILDPSKDLSNMTEAEIVKEVLNYRVDSQAAQN
jgi:hypothetical protein